MRFGAVTRRVTLEINIIGDRVNGTRASQFVAFRIVRASPRTTRQ
jgi:hypothetical protein